MFGVLPGRKRDYASICKYPHNGIIAVISKMRIYPKDISISRLDKAQTDLPGITGFRKQALVIVRLMLRV